MNCGGYRLRHQGDSACVGSRAKDASNYARHDNLCCSVPPAPSVTMTGLSKKTPSLQDSGGHCKKQAHACLHWLEMATTGQERTREGSDSKEQAASSTATARDENDFDDTSNLRDRMSKTRQLPLKNHTLIRLACCLREPQTRNRDSQSVDADDQGELLARRKNWARTLPSHSQKPNHKLLARWNLANKALNSASWEALDKGSANLLRSDTIKETRK